MTTYRKIHGRAIKSVSSNLSAPSAEGQVWFNTTDNKFRSVVSLEAWSSTAPMLNQTRQRYATGTQTAGLVFGGYLNPNTNTGLSEEYNGNGFASGGTMSTARRSPGGAGTQTSSLAIGGYTSTAVTTVEEYNGSSWTSSPALNNAKFIAGSFGTSSACVTEGGAPAPKAFETWDDSSWTAGPGPIGPSNSYGAAAAGTSTAGLFAGGYPASPTDNLTRALEFDGSSFSSTGSTNTSRGYAGGFGVQTSAVICGGKTGPGPNSTATETYDGSSFTTSPATLGTALAYGGACGTSSAGLAAGFSAHPPSFPILAEEYNKSSSAFTAAAWASGPSLGTGRYLAGYGTTPTNTTVVFGGHTTTSVANTEEFNGTSFSEDGDMNTARSRITGFGTQTATVTMGGRQVSTPNNNMNNTELYNGSSWTNGPTYPTSARGIGGAGTNSAGLAISTWTGSAGSTLCNDWDGSSWTSAEGNLNTARGYASGWGTQSDAGAAGGSPPPAGLAYEEYNGTSWTTKNSMITNVPSGGEAGFGGTPGAIKGNGNGNTHSQEWSGTSWSTAASRANTNYGGGMSGGDTATSGIIVGGYIYPSTGPATGSEEFTGVTTALNVKDLTQS